MKPFLCGGERVKRFVNIYLLCIVSNLKRVSKISTLFPLEKYLRKPVCAHMRQQLFTDSNWLTHESNNYSMHTHLCRKDFFQRGAASGFF